MKTASRYNTRKLHIAEKIARKDIDNEFKSEITLEKVRYFGYNSLTDIEIKRKSIQTSIFRYEKALKEHYKVENNDELIVTLRAKSESAFAVNLFNEIRFRFSYGSLITGEIVLIDEEFYLEILPDEQYVKCSELESPYTLSKGQISEIKHKLYILEKELSTLETNFYDDWTAKGKYLFNNDQISLNMSVL